MIKSVSLLRNVSSNLLAYAFSAIVAFFLSPFVVHSLGDRSYGLWTLVISFVGYYGILDLGVRSAVGHYVTRYWARGDVEGVSRTLSTALGLTLIVSGVIFLVTVVVALNVPSLFNLEEDQADVARWLVLILGLGQCLLLPLALAGVATYARKRFDLSIRVGIPSKLLTAGLTVWALKAGHGLVGLALVTVGIAILAGTARTILAFYLLPGVKLSVRRFTIGTTRELGGYGLWNFLVNVAERVMTHTDAIIIGAFLSTAAITYYAVAGNLIPYYISLINAASWVLAPYITAFDAEGDTISLRRFWVSGTRWLMAAAALVGGGLIFLGGDFLSLWMGERFVSGETYTSSAVILAILAAASMARVGMSCGKQICFGMREVRFLGFASITEAVLNLVISVALVRPFGLLGVTIGTLIPILVIYLWVLPSFVCRKLGMNLWSFLRHTTGVAGVLVLSMGILSALIGMFVSIDSWAAFLLKCFMVAIPSAVAGFYLGASSDSRQELLDVIRRVPQSESSEVK